MTHQTTARLPIVSVLVAAVFVLGCDDPPLEPDSNPETVEIAMNGSPGVLAETEDVFGQGMNGPVIAQDGARLSRTPKGISAHFSMPTPEPGTYMYPEAGAAFSGPGHPEAFTLWAFVFNNPEECGIPNACTAADLGEPAGGGAFFVAGHIVGGPHLNLSGRISTNTEPFPTPTPGSRLENIEEAHVHLAVAPHGALEPELLPEQIQTPTQPGPDIWWLALFE